MSENAHSYRQILKNTSLFGGVQFINIIIAIIKSKVIAVLLGPAGIGILGLLTSATSIVSSLTNFGLGVSAVNEVAGANINANQERISCVGNVLNKLSWITGVLGTLVTLFFSSLLSLITFGNSEYTLAFTLLAVTLLFAQLTAGNHAMIQGMQRLKSLAKANLFAAISGMILSLPLFYFFRFNGIVPSIIAGSVCSLFFSWYYAKQLPIRINRIAFKDAFREGKSMLSMGFFISLNGILIVASSYIIRSFIANTSGVEEVGLFNAGFTIINTYVGAIFISMQTEYYPRLSAKVSCNKSASEIVNQQAEIATLILAPILIILIVLIKWGLIFLYSNKFLPVETMIQWASVGIFFKTASWALSFVLISKANSKIFIVNEFIATIYTLLLNIIGYNFFGLVGLGVSFTLSYFLYFIQVSAVLQILYKIRLKRDFWLVFFIQFPLALSGLLVMTQITMPFSLILGIIFVLISLLYSLIKIHRRLDLQWLEKLIRRK